MRASPEEAGTRLDRAIDYYRQAHARSPRAWTGVNLAVLRLAAGDEEGSRRGALEVLELIATQATEDPGWSELTRAECYLALGMDEEAAGCYAAACRMGVSEGRLASARRNAQIVADARGIDRTALERLFPPPSILVFTGHRIDTEPVRFPSSSEQRVMDAIRTKISDSGAKVAIASASDGADILFLEAMLDAGGEIHVVLPWQADEFKRTSVRAGAWLTRFEAVMARATTVTVISLGMNDPVDAEFGAHMVLGLAMLRAQQYGGRLTGIAVWDGKPGPAGGVATTVRLWNDHGLPCVILDPLDGAARLSEAYSGPAADPQHEAKGILFADAVGFSSLTGEQISRFAIGILGPLGARLDELGETVLCRNTWGDALYIVFSSLEQAALFAADVTRACSQEALRAHGLPSTLSFRVSLHAGPVREVFDPVTKRRNFIGPHVNWAARIEPITPSGAAYVSEPFAALCSLRSHGLAEFAYAGNVPLAKGYATVPLYSLKTR